MVIMKVPKLKNQLHSPIQRIYPPDSIEVQIDGCAALVKVGDIVSVGDLIAKSANESDFERRIHSPFNGEIISISENAISIQGDWPISQMIVPHHDPMDIDADEIREKCRMHGIVGMGGAMTPTHIKLIGGSKIDTVLVNISESEPFLTCDHRVLEEYPHEIDRGLKLVMKAVGAEAGLIAPKKNNYTSGYERFLVEETLGRKVPASLRPTDVGVLVLNLQTVRALYHAVFENQPLTQRVITVDGDAVKRPGNYLVPIGATVGHILNCCGWDEKNTDKIILGGPMMGNVADKNTSIKAGTGGVLALTSKQASEIKDNPCIRCGKCMEACSLGLPVRYMERKPSAELLECIECGACQFVCPAERPILSNIRKAKNTFIQKRKPN